jgi:hypothetical protein
MPAVGELVKARGYAAPKIAYAEKSVTGTGSFTASEFGVRRIIAPLAAVITDAPGAIPSQTVEITGFTSDRVDVVVIDHTTAAGSEHAVSTTARTVRVVVVGE